jgi:predicted RNase H-like HicB family nuclease
MQKFQNYRLVVEKEAAKGKKSHAVYNAYCPALGLADWGNTIDKAVENITKLISFHIKSLAVFGRSVPSEHNAIT